jgi:hypothetical protein
MSCYHRDAMRLTFLLAVPLVAALLPSMGLTGCAASGGDNASGSSNSGGAGGAPMGGQGGTGNGFATGGMGGYVEGEAEVYGHSDDTLYKLDPLTKQVTTVGQFDGCDGMLDLAIDKSGTVIGTTFDGLYWIDKNTAACTEIMQGTYPNSLSFVPQGTLDPNSETLVGYNVTDYVRIDTTTGAITTVTTGAITGGYQSSGDIVSVIGGGTFLTIKDLDCDDCLVEVDPATGVIITNYGDIGQSKIFGLAFWGGSAYGFTSGGTLFEINFDMGTVSTTILAVPGAPADLKFWGAGSSTSAPIAPPD